MADQDRLVNTSRSTTLTSADRDHRQTKVAAWCAAAFGADHASSLPQRAVRMLEEAIELYQACGGDIAIAHKLLNFVFARAVGSIKGELGGVGLTTLALAEAADLSADQAEVEEFNRVLGKSLEHFHQRNEDKNAAGFNITRAYPDGR